jgi:hypothetical protein
MRPPWDQTTPAQIYYYRFNHDRSFVICAAKSSGMKLPLDVVRQLKAQNPHVINQPSLSQIVVGLYACQIKLGYYGVRVCLLPWVSYAALLQYSTGQVRAAKPKSICESRSCADFF